LANVVSGEVAISGRCCEVFGEVQALVCESMPGIDWLGEKDSVV
jgi:hypothetical protein